MSFNKNLKFEKFFHIMKNSLDINKPVQKTRIVVAMSGGVDSSVVAAMLAREGYEVVGVTLQLYNSGEMTGMSGTCCAGQDIEDARRVCELLQIPHYVLNYEKKFQEKVINPFINDYKSGKTPVPCIACNQTVKFNDLLNAAKQLGADALATGHYLKNILLPNSKHRALYRAKDLNRDQSYFLFATTQEQIDYLRFPLGDLPKSEVRSMAKEIGLNVATKPDSQDICFVAKGSYTDYINNSAPDIAHMGNIIHINGEVLGQHNGVYNYTIGQRRGLGIAYKEPLYVIKINAVTSQIIVGPYEALLTHSILLNDVNWLGDASPTQLFKGYNIFAKVRSTRDAKPAKLYYKDNIYTVVFNENEYGVAPGQACVFFDNNTEQPRLLGGGFIKDSFKDSTIEAAINNLVYNDRAR